MITTSCIKYIVIGGLIGWFSPFPWYATAFIILITCALISFLTFMHQQSKMEKQARHCLDAIRDLMGPSMSEVSPENEALIHRYMEILRTLQPHLTDEKLKDWISKMDYIFNMQDHEMVRVLDKVAKQQFAKVVEHAKN